jgi:hypothetical protein
MEVLADEADVSPERMQDYWTIAADLLGLVTDVEEYRAGHPRAGYEEAEMVALRRRLRDIGARLSELTLE